MERLSFFRVFTPVMISIFLGEMVVMFVLSIMPPMPSQIKSFLDSVLLVILVSPIIYFYIFHAITLHIIESRNILFKIMIYMFLCELIIMFILPLLHISPNMEILVDSSFLVIMVSPVFYFIIFVPMMKSIIENIQAEERLILAKINQKENTE